MGPTLASMVVLFEEHLTSNRRYSPHTVRCYAMDVRSFIESLPSGAEAPVEALDRGAIRSWIAGRVQKGDAAVSVNRGIASLKSFVRFLMKRELLGSNPMQAVHTLRQPKPLPHEVDYQELRPLLKREAYPEGFEGERDFLIVTILYGLGLRRSEASNLRWADFDRHLTTVRVVGKGSKTREVPVMEVLAEQLDRYRALQAAQGIESGFVFTLADGTPLGHNRLYGIVRRLIASVSRPAPYRGPHALRHSCASHLLQNGADVLSIKKILGHSSLATTQRYTHIDAKAIATAYQKSHPHAES